MKQTDSNKLTRFKIVYGDDFNRLADGENSETLTIFLHANSVGQAMTQPRFDGLYIFSIREA